MAGVPMREISLYLGHTDEATTGEIYAHHNPEYLRRASAALVKIRS